MTNLQETTDAATRKKMRSVRQAGTSPELAVRAVLESLGIEFSTNVHGKPGRPDIWLTGIDTPIFVHGCFWHRHPGCRKTTTPKKNRGFWIDKFQRNMERDERNFHRLQGMGYSPVTVWQCETADEDALKEILISRVEGASVWLDCVQ